MIESKLHNDLYVKKVNDITTLFKWNSVLTKGFPQLPDSSIVLDDVLVNKYKGLNSEAYMHHTTLCRRYGKIYCAYTIHDYDEDASGMYVGLSISEDDGATWSYQVISPQMSDMAVYGTYPAQWTYPSLFLDLPSGLYLLINGVDGIVGISDYTPLGTLVRKINTNNTLGALQWVNNSINEDSRVIPTPISGYTSYSFASESLINEVKAYISQKMYRPKVLFGWSEIWITQYGSGTSYISEPTEIRPYNYPFTQSLHFWKQQDINFSKVQDTDDLNTLTSSEIPSAKGNPVTRVINYSPEKIIIVAPTSVLTRTEIMLCVSRKNNETGRYEINNGDVYNITNNTKSSPVYTGKNKIGGVQLPFINKVGKDLLDIGFSVSKEEIYFKTIDMSKL